MKEPVFIFWFRRDLRLHDNVGLYHALFQAKLEGKKVLPLFIFDRNILSRLEDKIDRRVDFIYRTLVSMQEILVSNYSSFLVKIGTPTEVFKELLNTYNIEAIYANHDYEPYSLHRDNQVEDLAKSNGTTYYSFKDHVIFEKNEVQKDNGNPYTVFTPYSRKWKLAWAQQLPKHHPSEKLLDHFLKCDAIEIPSLQTIGFQKTNLVIPSQNWTNKTIQNYSTQRDFPALLGTSHLGVHLRFGTISIRGLALGTSKISETFLNELIWRDFYQMILWHFPQIAEGKSFKAKYDFIQWRNDENEFKAWCNGNTGYPIVDAGMRELNATGYMHNRVRMIVASFLTKHLLIDWRWGEAYFAEKLLDFDFAANNGGWQWASGSGCDAVPYFRVFNPSLQAEKFDKQLLYIKKWVPELNSLEYPKPIVVHEEARIRAIETYAKFVKQ